MITGYAYYGEYPIHFAAATGNQEIYDYLIDHGANPNAQDTFGNTALHMVVICNQVVRLYNDEEKKTHQTPTFVFFYFITCVVQFIAAIIYCSTVYPPPNLFWYQRKCGEGFIIADILRRVQPRGCMRVFAKLVLYMLV